MTVRMQRKEVRKNQQDVDTPPPHFSFMRFEHSFFCSSLFAPFTSLASGIYIFHYGYFQRLILFS